MKILLVEDDFKLGQATKRLFEYEHCAVDWAQDGAEALKLLESSLECTYDVIVLDWMLPEINGLSLCRLMRNKYGYQGGIIFVTAKGEVDDCVQALDTGADDFVVKPFQIKELLARINAVCRRKSKPFVDTVYSHNGVSINRDLCTVACSGAELRLRKKEFSLFEILFVNLNTILPRAALFEKVWFDKPETNMESLDSHIYMLRKNLRIFPKIRITLIKNVGYRMEIDP